MGGHILIDILDRTIDVLFMCDIFINFRTGYINDRTGKLETSYKKIAFRYILYGRFPIDFVASLPIEFVQLVLDSNNGNFKFLGMMKLVRLLRLGRMVSFLKANQKLKFSIKAGQLIMFVFLITHWINCLWYFVVTTDEKWFPPKDQDKKKTEAYEGTKLDRYLLFYYYGVLTLVSNELLPTNYYEILVATMLVLIGTIFIGLIIGEFTSLLSSITK